MAHNAIRSWLMAERFVFQYIENAVRSSEAEGAIGEFPITAPHSRAELRQWSFEISGDADTFNQIRAGDRPRAWIEAGGSIRGVFRNREDAQQFAGMIENALPIEAADNVQDIIRVQYQSSLPSLTRSTIEIAPSDDVTESTEGGEIRVWLLEWMLKIVFATETV